MVILYSWLQKHSFNLDKNLNNLVHKNDENRLKNIFKKLEELLNDVKKCSTSKYLVQKLKNCYNYHTIEKVHKDKTYRIIKDGYKDLYDDLLDILGNQDKGGSSKKVFYNIDFYQCSMQTSRERLIFTFDEHRFFPLFLDLKHVIYPASDKKFDNNSKQEIYSWSYCDKNKKVEIWK